MMMEDDEEEEQEEADLPLPWWKNCGTPGPRKDRPKGGPMGNPVLLNPVTAKDPAFNPGMKIKTGMNPGGKIFEKNKSIRKALLRLMAEVPGKQSKPKTKADEIARKLYDLAKGEDGRGALIAIKEIADRVDGKAAPSPQELDALKASGPSVVMIDARMRPDRNEPITIIEHQRPVLSESSSEDESEQ